MYIALVSRVDSNCMYSKAGGPTPQQACKPNNIVNSNIEKLWALNQQLSKILVVLVVVVPYV
jgi:hypothetical protein